MSVEKLLEVYIKEVFIKYGVLVKIILNRDLRFVLVFWEAFTVKQKI